VHTARPPKVGRPRHGGHEVRRCLGTPAAAAVILWPWSVCSVARRPPKAACAFQYTRRRLHHPRLPQNKVARSMAPELGAYAVPPRRRHSVGQVGPRALLPFQLPLADRGDRALSRSRAPQWPMRRSTRPATLPQLWSRIRTELPRNASARGADEISEFTNASGDRRRRAARRDSFRARKRAHYRYRRGHRERSRANRTPKATRTHPVARSNHARMAPRESTVRA
jgi:hypothetical protein